MSRWTRADTAFHGIMIAIAAFLAFGPLAVGVTEALPVVFAWLSGYIVGVVETVRRRR